MKENFEFKNSYNDILKGYKWLIKEPKKILVLVTGMAEHSLRYNDFALFLNEAGFNVYCLDHYGQGENVKDIDKLGIVPPNYFFKMIETINELVLSLKEEFKDLEIDLFSHSMGSFITQGYIEKYSANINKVVLCGTNGPNALVGMGNLVAKIIVNKKNFEDPSGILHKLSIGTYEKSLKDRTSNNDWLSYNKENVNKYCEDAYCGHLPSNGFYKEFLKGLNSIQKKKNIKNISKDLKILITGGKDDAVGNFSKGLIKLYDIYHKAGLNVYLKIYENMRHEILNESDKEVVYQNILDFFNN